MYYYGYELVDDECSLAHIRSITNERDKIPVIFDLVLTEVQVSKPKPSSSLTSQCKFHITHAFDERLRDMPVNFMINIGDTLELRNTADVTNIAHENSKLPTFYGNWAFMYYVRLCMYVTITHR